MPDATPQDEEQQSENIYAGIPETTEYGVRVVETGPNGWRPLMSRNTDSTPRGGTTQRKIIDTGDEPVDEDDEVIDEDVGLTRSGLMGMVGKNARRTVADLRAGR